MSDVPPPQPRNGSDTLAAALRGFGPVGILAIFVVMLAGTLFGLPAVLLWTWLSRTPWRDIGYVKLTALGWLRTVLLGIVIGVALKLAMKSIVMPLLGAPEHNAAYQWLVGNTRALPGMLAVVIFGAGLGEESVWRGFGFERLGKLLGKRPWARAVTLIVTSVLFGLGHIPDQGWPGAQQATLTGMVFGGLYLATGSLWLSVVTHAAFDIAAIVIIYFGWEGQVAHVFFR